MTPRFRIIIPTQKTKADFEKTTTYLCLSEIMKTYDNCDLLVASENRIGLSQLYQTAIEDAEENVDYILFMHDDLEIHDHFMFKKLLKAHEQYDIVGLAGATSQNYSKDGPTVWHLCREKPEHARGIVGHYIPKGFNGVTEAHVNSAYFGPTPGRVVVIDGLFMSIKLSKILPGRALFDKMFTFHHYDLAMCCNAIDDHKMTIGVWPIYVVHHGLGEFAHDPIWQDHNKKFKAKFGAYRRSV